MRAIETTYKGTTYRSRLEARWACFFDAIGWRYVYEPEGFECAGDTYLPDFELLEPNVYVSIKSLRCKQECGKDWWRELIWRGDFAANGKEMWIIYGAPVPCEYGIVMDYGSDARFTDCRRCAGVCYEMLDGSGWGDIGKHTCDSEKWPSETKRIDAAMLRAMRHRFGERQ